MSACDNGRVQERSSTLRVIMPRRRARPCQMRGTRATWVGPGSHYLISTRLHVVYIRAETYILLSPEAVTRGLNQYTSVYHGELVLQSGHSRQRLPGLSTDCPWPLRPARLGSKICFRPATGGCAPPRCFPCAPVLPKKNFFSHDRQRSCVRCPR